MKKRRFWQVFPVMILSIVMGLSLVACGGNGANDSTGGNRGEDISTVITKEQWNAAFGVGNFLKDAKIVYKQEAKQDALTSVKENTLLLSGQTCGSYSVTDTFTRNNVKSSESVRIYIMGDHHEDYYSKESYDDSGAFTEGEWRYGTVDTHDYAADNYAYWKENVLDNIEYDYLSKIAERYENFTYSANAFSFNDSTGIVLESESEEDDGAKFVASMTATAVTVTMTDNKLSSVTMTCKYVEELTGAGDEDYSDKADVTISYTFTYGAQTVEAPAGVKPQA